jgi:hypothetical protein
MRVRPVHLFQPLVAGLTLFVSAGAARADTISIADNTLPGLFTGSVSVTNQTTTSAVITMTLKNASPPANGGYITAIGFNNPGTTALGNITGVSSFSATFVPSAGQQFQLIGGPSYNSTLSGAPFGNFDIGAAVGGDLLGTGNPTTGIAVGQTGTFTFDVTGQGLNNLSAADILSATSSTGVAGMFVRYRGFCDGTSDKDVISVTYTPPDPPPPHGVPVPPSALLAGLGLGCLFLGRLRFRSTPAARA